MVDPASREFNFPEMMSTFGFALPFWCSPLLLSLLDWPRALLTAHAEIVKEKDPAEWVRAVLKAYEEALKDPARATLAGEESRRFATLLMRAYLDLSQLRQEYGHRLLAVQSDLVRGYLEILEGALRSWERKTLG
jgi:hypothetical protein